MRLNRLDVGVLRLEELMGFSNGGGCVGRTRSSASAYGWFQVVQEEDQQEARGARLLSSNDRLIPSRSVWC